MGRTCRNICTRYQADPVPNKIRYEIGQKRCTFCGIFLSLDDVRCICCKAVLRTKPRSKRKQNNTTWLNCRKIVLKLINYFLKIVFLKIISNINAGKPIKMENAITIET